MTVLLRIATCLAISSFLWPGALLASEEKVLAGQWKGEITIPGTPLTIDVDFRLTESGWEGDISIPAQNARDSPLANIVLEDKSVSFDLPGVPGKPKFRVTMQLFKRSGKL